MSLHSPQSHLITGIMNISHGLVVQCLFYLLLFQFTHAEGKIGDRRVKLVPNAENWFSAFEICRRMGMQLLSVHNERENNEAQSLMRKHQIQSAWLAATDLGHEGRWNWVTSGAIVTYTNWATVNSGRRAQQPDNWRKNEHCLQIELKWTAHPKRWNDCECVAKLKFFCEDTKESQRYDALMKVKLQENEKSGKQLKEKDNTLDTWKVEVESLKRDLKDQNLKIELLEMKLENRQLEARIRSAELETKNKLMEALTVKHLEYAIKSNQTIGRLEETILNMREQKDHRENPIRSHEERTILEARFDEEQQLENLKVKETIRKL